MSDPNAKEKNRTALYVEFHKHDQNGEYDRALKVVNKILHLFADDKTAIECKGVCLIYLNRFDEALAFLTRNAKQSADMHFEKAYCLYRTNQSEKALSILHEANTDHRCQELRAQLLYRLERYEDAFQVYDEIIRNAPDDEYEDERQTNLAAVVAMHTEKVTKNLENQLKENTYEMCYNKALVFCEKEMYIESEKLLKKAEKLLRESFEEDGASEEDTDAELSQIRVLQAFCLQKQNRGKEAYAMYTNALKMKSNDVALTAIASNNMAAINKDQNVFDSKKKMKSATNEQLVHKLPDCHRKYIALNNAIFHYYSNHHEQVTSTCNSVEKQWPELKSQVNLVRALNLHKMPTKKNVAIDLLLKTAEECKESDESFMLRMTCVQLLLEDGEKSKACEVLENLGEQRYQPGIIGALITLYTHLNKDDVALQIFEQAVEWYERNEDRGMDLTNLFRQAAEFHMRSGRPEVAAQSLEQLLARNPDDLKVQAQLVIAYAQFDEEKAIAFSAKLGDANEFIDIDLSAAESSSWLNTKKATAASVSKTELSPGVSNVKKRKHRKKKGKLPKNYDANVAPDPERWLPRYERSGYRKKRDRRARDVIKGSQGTTAGHSEQFDYSKIANEDESAASSVDPSPMQKTLNPRLNQKKGGVKKKNKRR